MNINKIRKMLKIYNYYRVTYQKNKIYVMPKKLLEPIKKIHDLSTLKRFSKLLPLNFVILRIENFRE
jgi:hypothetical protein